MRQSANCPTRLAKGVSKANKVSLWEEEKGQLSCLPNMQPEYLKLSIHLC